MSEFETVILSAYRTPIGALGGMFTDLSAVDPGAVAIREAVARAAVKGSDIGDVVMGDVLQAGAGITIARQAALARIGSCPPATTLRPWRWARRL